MMLVLLVNDLLNSFKSPLLHFELALEGAPVARDGDLGFFRELLFERREVQRTPSVGPSTVGVRAVDLVSLIDEFEY